MYQRRDPVPSLEAPPRRAPWWHRAIAFLMKAALPVALLLGAAEIAREIYTSAPGADRAAPERQPRLVATSPVRAAERGPEIRAWGVVEPARRLVLRPEIGGRVAELHPDLTPGGLVSEGEVLVALDDRERRLELAEAGAEIAQIEAQIRLEQGQRARAERDLARSPLRDLTEEQRALILREPQMNELQARLSAAEARREAARLALDKTVLRAPFDAVVQSEELAPGTVLTAGSEIARLVGTERFRVVLAVPPAALHRIEAAESAEVRLAQPGVWEAGAARSGEIARIRPELSETGRMAEVVVEVADPLARDGAAGPRLLLGTLLEARILLPAIPGSVAVDRTWIRGESRVWVDAGGRLEIRQVEIAWAGPETALVTAGLAPGERVVTTLIDTVADGMAIRTREDGA